MGYAEQHMRESAEIIEKMDLAPIEKMADLLATGERPTADESSSSASAAARATAPMR